MNFTSQLHDEKTFYKAFTYDLESCIEEVIIESPYITLDRSKLLLPIFRKLLNHNIGIYVVTRSRNKSP